MSKSLTKSNNRMIFGVCGGISNWSGIDVSFVRIGFVLGAIFSGSLILWAYLLLALVLPNEKE